MEILKTEAKIQQECVLWYKNGFCLKHHSPRSMIFSIPNEGRGAASMQLMATGLYPGMADIQVIHRHLVSYDNGFTHQTENCTVFIEVKIPSACTGPRKNGQSQKQIDFEEHCIAMGIPYYIVRSLDEFKHVIELL